MNLQDSDYVLTENAGWFDVKGFAIRINGTDDGVVVDIFSRKELEQSPYCEALASTYAFDHETEEEVSASTS